MNKKIYYILIIIISVFFISCDIQFFTPGPYHIIEWACIMNYNGTELEYLYEIDVEEMYFPNGVKFTQDSQKIIFGLPEGLFTRDFTGNIEKISNLKKDEFSFYSSDLEYMYHIENNDIYRMKFDGTERINLTNTPDETKSEAFLSNDDQYITYVVLKDNLYKLCKININGDNLQEVYNSTEKIRYPKYNTLNDEIYFRLYNDLLSINLSNNNISTINPSINRSTKFNISRNQKFMIYSSLESRGYWLNYYDIVADKSKILKDNCNKDSKYSINHTGNCVVLGGASTGGHMFQIDISEAKMIEIGKGINPFISPDGEKIFFTKGVEASENIE